MSRDFFMPSPMAVAKAMETSTQGSEEKRRYIESLVGLGAGDDESASEGSPSSIIATGLERLLQERLEQERSAPDQEHTRRIAGFACGVEFAIREIRYTELHHLADRSKRPEGFKVDRFADLGEFIDCESYVPDYVDFDPEDSTFANAFLVGLLCVFSVVSVGSNEEALTPLRAESIESENPAGA